jgi:hypothetical protein
MTKDEAWALADHWAAAWNAHDLDLIMTHYEDAIELTSPVAARLLGTPDGKVNGKPNLRLSARAGSLSTTSLPSRGRALGHKQHRALLHKSDRNAYGGIHGIVPTPKSGSSRGELQFLGVTW